MSAALDQREVPAKHDEHLKKSASLDREISSPKGKLNKTDSNGVDSSNQSRDGTPTDQRRRSPSTDTKKAAAALVQMHNAATPPITKQNSQSPKSKPSTPVSTKRNDSIEEMTDKFDSLATPSPKHQKNIKSNSEDAPPSNKKQRGTFLTDREYLTEHDNEKLEELEAWQPDPELPYEQHNDVQHGRGKGWNADEMFRVNTNLGVHSSYNGIDQDYCTAMPQGDEEARRRADQIAAEIERNKDSQRAALLENDDNEQDLDKLTQFDDRESGNRGSKSQSSGSYSNKDNRRSQFNSGGSAASNSGGRNYSNSPRNSYPNTGSGSQSTNSGSNRYGSNSQSRQQPPRGPYTQNYPPSNAPSRKTAPTSTSWRTESHQQSGNNYAKATAKSPSLHSEERRQSASPATSKYSTDSSTTASVRRTNSVQNRQQQVDYSPKPENYQQIDRRVPENQYHDGSSSSSSIPPQTASPQSHPQVEIQPLITPIPKQTQQQYEQNRYESSPHQQGNKDEPNKKFTFNPNAPVFVPKAPTQIKTTPTPGLTQSMPMQVGIPQQVSLIPSQHQLPPQQIVGMQNVPQYNSPQMIQPMGMMQVSMQQNQMIYPMPIQPQQRTYQQVETAYVDSGKILEAQQQQKFMAQMQRGVPVQQLQYVQQPQYAPQQHSQMIPQQMLSHPQITGPSYQSNQPSYQHAPPIIPQGGTIYPSYYNSGQ